MAFTTYCTNKKCGQMQAPYIDPSTNIVYCSLCDLEITNLTSFTKIQMKNNKQFKEKKQIPFAVKCKKCNNEDQPIIVNNVIVCSKCKSKLDNLSAVFQHMLRDLLKTTKNDV